MNHSSSFIQQSQATVLKFGSLVTILFIFAIYFSTGLSTLFSIVLGIVWLGSAQFLTLPSLLKMKPVAFWSLLLFICFLLGSSYSNASLDAAMSMAKKYRELFYIPILMAFFNTDQYRRRAWLAFVAASVLSLLISYLKLAGIFELNQFGDASVKSHITHNIFIAYFAFYCAHQAFSQKPDARYYLALLIVCVHNLFLVVQGLTGQAVFLALVLLFTLQRFSKKFTFLALAGICLAMLLFLNFSDKAERLNKGINDTKTYFQNESSSVKSNSSMGQRYMFWKYSSQLIAEKPLLGYGTGSFAQEYQRIAQGEHVLAENPHNEFLMIGVQLGLFGLIVYLGFLGSQIYCSYSLPADIKFMAQGLVLTLVITSLFNSPILDNTEGHWFATLIALCFSTPQISSAAKNAWQR